jgi:hypothetical protein
MTTPTEQVYAAIKASAAEAATDPNRHDYGEGDEIILTNAPWAANVHFLHGGKAEWSMAFRCGNIRLRFKMMGESDLADWAETFLRMIGRMP